jgi:hypothetical protein
MLLNPWFMRAQPRSKSSQRGMKMVHGQDKGPIFVP